MSKEIGGLARMGPPEIIIRKAAKLPRDAPFSIRQDDRHLNFPAGAQHLERHILAVAANPQIDTRQAELQIA
jgi:hypothetical protein